MYITLSDAALAVLFVLAVVIGSYLIVLLRKLLCIAEQVEGLLGDNSDNINEILTTLPHTLVTLPKTLETIEELAVSIKETVSQTTSTLDPLQDTISDTIEELREGLESAAFYIKMLVDIVRMLFFRK